jgi:hypothetical protein
MIRDLIRRHARRRRLVEVGERFGDHLRFPAPPNHPYDQILVRGASRGACVEATDLAPGGRSEHVLPGFEAATRQPYQADRSEPPALSRCFGLTDRNQAGIRRRLECPSRLLDRGWFNPIASGQLDHEPAASSADHFVSCDRRHVAWKWAQRHFADIRGYKRRSDSAQLLLAR